MRLLFSFLFFFISISYSFSQQFSVLSWNIANLGKSKFYKNNIEREPYIGSFVFENIEFKIFNFHAVPKKSNPEKEIKFFKEFTKLYGDNLIFLGDFNVANTNSVFNPIYKQGFVDAFPNQKTTLKQKCINNDCLANAYDHIFYQQKKIKLIKAEAILFFTKFKDIKLARKISDHIPVVAVFEFVK